METIQIGALSADPGLCQLTCGERIVRLEPKAMSAFLFLARHVNDTCTRDALFAHCWPNVTVGEDALNRVIYQLRAALTELEAPARILTVPKIGYRLVADMPADAPAEASAPPQNARPRLPRALLMGALAVGLAALTTGAFFLWPSQPQSALFSPIFTSPAIGEFQPGISPDGKQLVFVRKAGKDFQLILKGLPDASERVLYTSSGFLMSPAWSPDGQRLAFAGMTPEGCEYRWLEMARPENGRSMGHCGQDTFQQISWAPDSKTLYVSYAPQLGQIYGLYRLNIDGSRTLMTQPPPESVGDLLPAASPDGRWLAFLREGVARSGQVMLFDLRTREITPLKNASGDIYGLTWSADSQDIYMSIDRGVDRNVWAYPVSGARPFRLLNGISSTGLLSAPFARNDMLAVETKTSRTALMRMDMATRRTELAEADAAGQNEDPAPAANGRDAVFVSTRTGKRHIWRLNNALAAPLPISLPNGIARAPALSPDGRQLAFVLLRESQRQLYTAGAEGGPLRRVSTARNAYSAVWLPDNRLAYVADGRIQMPDGPVGPTGIEAMRYAGGQFYVMRKGYNGLWRMDASGKMHRITDAFVPADAWDVSETHIAWVDRATFTLWLGDTSAPEKASNTDLSASVHSSVRFTADGRNLWYGRSMNQETRIQVLQSDASTHQP